jgi:O-antigen/teichoic acid export membrane protein
MYLKNIKQSILKLIQSNYYRNAFTLISGSVIAQLFLLVITPILSRIFTPDDFGLYASFLAVVGILSILGTLRYELAILLPEKQKEAISLFLLALLLSIFFAGFVLLFVPWVKNLEWVLSLTNINSSLIFFLIPLGIFLYDLSKSSSFLANRNKYYNWLSYGRITGSITTGTLSIICGLTGWGAAGLVIAKIIGWTLESMVFIFPAFKSIREHLPKINFNQLKTLASKYRNFPKYSTPEGLLNTGFKQIPVLLLTAWFSIEMAGHYGMAFMLLSKPLGMVSAAFGQVFFQRGASMDRTDQSSLRKLFRDNLKFLFMLAIIPCIIIALFAPAIFTFILGEKWEMTGIFVQWLMPFSFITFLKGPFSAMVDIKNKIGQNVFFEIGFLIISCLAFYVGYLQSDALFGVKVFSFGCSVLGLFQLLWFYKLTTIESNWA